MKGLDISFSEPSAQWWKDRRAEGYVVMVQNLWTGGFASNEGIKAVAANNLRRARLVGFRIAAYANASPPDWWPLKIQLDNIKLNAGAEWPNVKDVVIDAEIPGITMARVMELADAVEGEGKVANVLYSAKWFWSGHMGNSTDPRWKRFRIWPADYDGDPTIDWPRPFGPWQLADLIGKQYAGTTYINERDGRRIAVDLNTFRDSWLAPESEPEPPAEEEIDMGKILDAATVAANAIIRGAQLTEAEIAKAMKLPVAPAPAPPPAPTPAPTPPPAPIGTTYKVVGGDNLGEVALKYQSKWPAGMALWGRDGAVAKLAAHNGIDPNAGLSVGQVLKIPW